ncbi:MAG: hypothetical protein RRZ84_02850 [Romboutsia sp.]
MSELGKIEYNGITEFKNTLGVKDIKICIYTIPVKDLNIKHNENYQVVQKLKELNQNNKIIVFNEYIIGSFEEITNWGNLKYTDCEKRIININIATERKILERLLLEDIKNNIDESIYQTQKNSNSIYINQQVLIKNNLIIKRNINRHNCRYIEE